MKPIGKIVTKRCVAIADTHGLHEALGKISGDWLFHAGGLTENGTKAELREFNEWLGKLDFEEKFIVAGKSDLALEPSLIREGPWKGDPRDILRNAVYL